VSEHFLKSNEAHFEGETISPEEIDRAAASLVDRGLIHGAKTLGRRGPIRAETTDEGDPCVERYSGDGVRVIKTPVRFAAGERVRGAVRGDTRRECLDHLLTFGERHLSTVLAEYERHFNDHRPHQGHSLHPPLHNPSEVIDMTTRIRRRKTVTGLISEYRRAA
jgi:hypothetical protein